MKNLKYLSYLILFAFLISACTTNSTDDVGNNCANTCDYTLASGETAATVPSSLDGTYNLTYGFAQSGSPFADGTTATFIISNNELTVEVDGFECITLKNPVLIGTNNYKFKDDCRDNIGYNVSPNNDGSFNEINIEPLGQGWYGQFFQ